MTEFHPQTSRVHARRNKIGVRMDHDKISNTKAVSEETDHVVIIIIMILRAPFVL